MAVRQVEYGTIEAGALSDVIRVELRDMHLWLYPEDDGAVRVEWEEKSAFELFGFVADAD